MFKRISVILLAVLFLGGCAGMPFAKPDREKVLYVAGFDIAYLSLKKNPSYLQAGKGFALAGRQMLQENGPVVTTEAVHGFFIDTVPKAFPELDMVVIAMTLPLLGFESTGETQALSSPELEAFFQGALDGIAALEK